MNTASTQKPTQYGPTKQQLQNIHKSNSHPSPIPSADPGCLAHTHLSNKQDNSNQVNMSDVYLHRLVSHPSSPSSHQGTHCIFAS